MVAAEPACQTVSYPIKITTPNLSLRVMKAIIQLNLANTMQNLSRNREIT